MSAEIIPFVPLAPPRPFGSAGVQAAPRRRRFYAFADLVRAFALDDAEVTVRTQIEYLRRLHDQAAMPLPVNPRWWGGRLQVGAAMIGQRSRWCALEFDAWADSQRNPPPAAAMAADVPPLPPLVRHDCAQRARLLAGGER